MNTGNRHFCSSEQYELPAVRVSRVLLSAAQTFINRIVFGASVTLSVAPEASCGMFDVCLNGHKFGKLAVTLTAILNFQHCGRVLDQDFTLIWDCEVGNLTAGIQGS
ncbi:MAG: hypothetical protein V4555_18810 [Acidobacteriota bacterium]